MAVAVFVLLALLSAGIIALPLVRQRPGAHSVMVTEGVIDRAVRDRLRVRRHGGLRCPACDRGYELGDRFCVGCGAVLPQSDGAQGALRCPSCGAFIQEGDRFCRTCGAVARGREAS